MENTKINSNEIIEDYIPQKGDLFEWNSNRYWCVDSGNVSGVVIPVGDSYYISGFLWNYDKEIKCNFIRKATEPEMEAMGITL